MTLGSWTSPTSSVRRRPLKPGCGRNWVTVTRSWPASVPSRTLWAPKKAVPVVATSIQWAAVRIHWADKSEPPQNPKAPRRGRTKATYKSLFLYNTDDRKHFHYTYLIRKLITQRGIPLQTARQRTLPIVNLSQNRIIVEESRRPVNRHHCRPVYGWRILGQNGRTETGHQEQSICTKRRHDWKLFEINVETCARLYG